jgi:hypothetical protein
MNRSVPTLQGIGVILLVVILVVLIYNIQLTKQLGAGASAVGTVGGEKLTGVEQPKVLIGQDEALARQTNKTETLSADRLQHKRLAKSPVEKQQFRRQHRAEKGQERAEKAGK